MRSLPNILPSVKFPNFGNFSYFSCLSCSWKKKRGNFGKKLLDKNGPKVLIEGLLSKFPGYFSRNCFVFPYFPSFFSKYWNAKPSKYFALSLLNFQTLEMFPVFPAFPVFIGKKRVKFGKSCSIRTALNRKLSCYSIIQKVMPIVLGFPGARSVVSTASEGMREPRSTTVFWLGSSTRW